MPRRLLRLISFEIRRNSVFSAAFFDGFLARRLALLLIVRHAVDQPVVEINPGRGKQPLYCG